MIQNDYIFFTYKEFENYINNIIIKYTQGISTSKEKEEKIKEYLDREF